jgi:hypothetical protein
MKILFLEDRPSRQQLFLPNKADDVKTIKSLQEVFMPESNDCRRIIMEINQKKYAFDNNIELIIIHKSALETSGLEFIDGYCKINKVSFICFSGGISQIIYNNEDYEFLNINSTDFYGERLIPFLENFLNHNTETLLELVTKDWELSYMFLARQIIGNLGIENDEDSKNNLIEKLKEIEKSLKFDTKDLKKLNFEINKKILEL